MLSRNTERKLAVTDRHLSYRPHANRIRTPVLRAFLPGGGAAVDAGGTLRASVVLYCSTLYQVEVGFRS